MLSERSAHRTLKARRKESVSDGSSNEERAQSDRGSGGDAPGTGGLLGGAGPSASGDGDVPTVLTTFTVLQDIAQNVTGEHLEIESITKTGAEIHGYEPTPGTSRRPRRRI